ncbi:fungal specific transcription factor [Hirsutella rhossiliensis]|uniref:Fungal specific transcription factor domain-containing protein n=1 Tax=Hirsutella rhossiliensis TaxID=111463 RepID=A0A9P8N724_9HYPO|nr:fungal specific transcription factor domain-containing protein [Hirsutella rhossiliensis]KAH0968145.1 fungal specific transcription factor domain-containing protein [Hirsutella rhossiliensis]
MPTQSHVDASAKPYLAPVKKRIGRACDRCNQLRMKCDGVHPCSRCVEQKLSCEYKREKKTRGKAPRKMLAESAAGHSNQATRHNLSDMPESSSHVANDARAGPLDIELSGYGAEHEVQSIVSVIVKGSLADQGHSEHYRYQMSGYQGLAFGLSAAPCPARFDNNFAFPMGYRPLNGYPMAIPSLSPVLGSMAMSPMPPKCRYPVLEPLIPHLGSAISVSLACNLLDIYFSSSSAQMHPTSPYVLGLLFRRSAILHPTCPRRCKPALLASMLWVTAQASDAPLRTSSSSTRRNIRQTLLGLAVRLLKPLIDNAAAGKAPLGAAATAESAATAATVADAGIGVVHVDVAALMRDADLDAAGAAGQLDDVATYIHLATVFSVSEHSDVGLQWWIAAWSLARELKLGQELPLGEPRPRSSKKREAAEHEGFDECDISRGIPGFITEEGREERRRVWWMVYMVDRHLALSHNRRLILLDVECENLLQPMSDIAWQKGDFEGFTKPNPGSGAPSTVSHGASLSRFECSDHGIFGYFLPAMTILGYIVDLHHAKSPPGFVVGFRDGHELDSKTREIDRHLDVYGRSLKVFEERYVRRAAECVDEGEQSRKLRGLSSTMTEGEIKARIVLAYATHIMHVLHILTFDKWDPVSLLDDKDFWISSQSFITATTHAVSAANAVSQMLEYDPGLEFMPFFFGIYLLQGSLLFPLVADKLQRETSHSVVGACEVIVRAHEICVLTLSTEYQRNFGKVMRGALAVLRGHVPQQFLEQWQQRWGELLGLYRWTGDGGTPISAYTGTKYPHKQSFRMEAYAEDAKMYDGVKYERKSTGPFTGKFVSQGSIVHIDSEDYVEHRVLTKPFFL